MFISHKVGLGKWFEKREISTAFATVYSVAILGSALNSTFTPIINIKFNSIGLPLTVGFVMTVIGLLTSLIVHIVHRSNHSKYHINDS